MPVMLLAERGTAQPATGQPGPAGLDKPSGPGRSQTAPCGPQTAEDVAVGLALTVSWMLITGRRLHQHPLLHALPTEDLIDFWADDYITPVPPPLTPAESWAPPCR